MRRRLAGVLVLIVAWPLAPARAAMSDLERQRLVSHLEMTAGWLIDEVSGLTPEQLAFRRAPDEWSVADVLDHLNVVGQIYWEDLQAALKKPAGGRSAMSDAGVLWYGIDRSRRERAIPTEEPARQTRDLAKMIAAYRKHHDRLLQYIRTTNDDLRGHIVERQRCDAWQWALLISTHEQRHILQIREIKAHPDYPRGASKKASGGAGGR